LGTGKISKFSLILISKKQNRILRYNVIRKIKEPVLFLVFKIDGWRKGEGERKTI